MTANTTTIAPGQWSYWGLFAVDDINAVPKTYTPRKTFYTLAQISKYVRPGAQQIDVSGSVGCRFCFWRFTIPTAASSLSPASIPIPARGTLSGRADQSAARCQP